jgi:histidinol phosphatase-like enzyme (inositol monophosphatase family)
MQTLMQAAADVARLAGDVAVGYFGTGVAVDLKADGSPVTLADRTAEERARAWIEQRFPTDGVLGEEFGITRAGARRRWVIDPIDGTKSFVRGVPLWGTLVAVCEGEEVLAGAVYLPVAGELVAAAAGQGAWLNGARCSVSQVSAIDGATVLTTDERFKEAPHYRGGWEQLSQAAAVSRSWGDCYGYVLVATGRAEAMVDPVLSPWDAAAVLPIVAEAGGVFTDWSGRETAFGGSAVATNAVLAAEVRRRLADRPDRAAPPPSPQPTTERRGA